MHMSPTSPILTMSRASCSRSSLKQKLSLLIVFLDVLQEVNPIKVCPGSNQPRDYFLIQHILRRYHQYVYRGHGRCAVRPRQPGSGTGDVTTLRLRFAYAGYACHQFLGAAQQVSEPEPVLFPRDYVGGANDYAALCVCSGVCPFCCSTIRIRSLRLPPLSLAKSNQTALTGSTVFSRLQNLYSCPSKIGLPHSLVAACTINDCPWLREEVLLLVD